MRDLITVINLRVIVRQQALVRGTRYCLQFLSVCLSVCHVVVLHINECIYCQTFWTIWSFWAQPPSQNFKRNHLSVGMNEIKNSRGVWKLCELRPKSLLFRKRYETHSYHISHGQPIDLSRFRWPWKAECEGPNFFWSISVRIRS